MESFNFFKSGAQPYPTSSTVPGTGPILELFMRDGVVFASRSNGEQDVLWFAEEAGWRMQEKGAIEKLSDVILANAVPMEVVTPNV